MRHRNVALDNQFSIITDQSARLYTEWLHEEKMF
jgi:hypothetical protein